MRGIPFMSTEARKLKSPVQRAKERQHDSAIRRLKVESLVEESDGDTGVHVGHNACSKSQIVPWHVQSNSEPVAAIPAWRAK